MTSRNNDTLYHFVICRTITLHGVSAVETLIQYTGNIVKYFHNGNTVTS